MDRVLDRGIVIDYFARVSFGGIDTLMTVDGHYVVTSTQTQLEYARPFRPPRIRSTNMAPCFGEPAEAIRRIPLELSNTTQRGRKKNSATAKR